MILGTLGIGTTSPISGEGRSWHLYNDVNDGTVLSNATAVVQSLNRNAYINVTSAPAGTGGIQFRNTTGSNTTGEGGVIYSHGTQKMFFRTVATNQVTIDSSGNVGIGTSSPGEKLEVQGYIRSASGSDFINIRPDSIYLYRGSAGGSYIDNAKVGSATIFRTSNAADRDTEAMRITANGNVGIGTTNPSASLEVVSSTYPPLQVDRPTSNISTKQAAANFVSTSSGDMVDGFGVQIDFSIRDNANVMNKLASVGGRRSGADNSGALVFETTSVGTATERMRIDPAGNVGIGTTSPSGTLEVSAPTTAFGITSVSSATLGVSSGGGVALRTNTYPTAADQRLGGFFFGAFDSNSSSTLSGAGVFAWSAQPYSAGNAGSYITFETAPIGAGSRQQRMRIDASGNVGIGTKPP